MKKDIHLKYYPKAKITCACGRTFAIGSTITEMKTEICSQCHPFYTGKQKLVDTQGRVDRFKKILEKKEEISEKRKKTKTKGEKDQPKDGRSRTEKSKKDKPGKKKTTKK